LFRTVCGFSTTDYRKLRSKFWAQMSQDRQILQRFFRVRVICRNVIVITGFIETTVAGVQLGDAAFKEETLR